MSLALELPAADVFITHELYKRAPRKTDYLQEKLTLQDLAARMADQPEEVLPRFVDLAMEWREGRAEPLRRNSGSRRFFAAGNICCTAKISVRP
jgi:hypothetical protein